MTETIASTSYGPVSPKIKDNGILEYRGIPYAQSTGGERRFLPAVHPEPWRETLDATAYGPACPQAGMENTALVQNEDCLRINIWTPGLDSGARRPVMVWLHGGGFRAGSSAGSMTNGTTLSRDGDLVVVSLNHRLNLFGFLYLKELCSELNDDPYAANAGMMDIVFALKWVRDNIEQFGGDPGNVTIFGESGGGRKVSMLLGMPSAKGLFHRGIIESGAHPRGVPAELAHKFAAGLFEWLKLTPGDLPGIQKIPAADLFRETSRYIAAGKDMGIPGGLAGRWMMLSPVVDGTCLPAHPFDPASPIGQNIPFIIGTNKDEMALFYAREENAGNMTEEHLTERLQPVLGEKTQEIIGIHRRNRPRETPWDLLVSISSEDRRLLSIETAERRCEAGGAPVYMYLFTWESDFGLLKAAHAMEIPFVFNNVDRSPMTGSRPDRFELARTMSQTWIAFARSGDPNHEGLPQWKPYDPVNRATMIFDQPSRLAHDPRGEERRAWQGLRVSLPFEGNAFAGSGR
jgi:para-nitrobenzyl esterase|tara:strand:+ start:6840 stop:8390 length:1551 start_codon:yes stop_codon:yes gene_type:complete